MLFLPERLLVIIAATNQIKTFLYGKLVFNAQTFRRHMFEFSLAAVVQLFLPGPCGAYQSRSGHNSNA
jgi:hypothetical protein